SFFLQSSVINIKKSNGNKATNITIGSSPKAIITIIPYRNTLNVKPISQRTFIVELDLKKLKNSITPNDIKKANIIAFEISVQKSGNKTSVINTAPVNDRTSILFIVFA